MNRIRGIRNTVAELNRYQFGYVVGLILPITFFHFILRAVRVIHAGHDGGVLGWIDLYKSPTFFFAGLALVGAAAFERLSEGGWAISAMLVFQGILLVITAGSVVGHQFFMVTGSMLDYDLIVFGYGKLDKLAGMIESELSPMFVAQDLIAAAIIVVGPWLGYWLWGYRASKPQKKTSLSATAGLQMAGLGVASILIAAIPPFVSANTGFARTIPMQLALSGLDSPAEVGKNVKPADYGVEDATLKGEPKAKPNVALIMLESTRARSVGIYNDDIETTPYLDKLAEHEDTWVAERAYTVVPHTSKATVSMMCGIEPRLTMPVIESGKNAIPAQCLPDLLNSVGYRTAYFSSATKHFEGWTQLVKNWGFDEFYPVETMDTSGFASANYFGYEDDVMLKPTQDWLRKHSDEPFFMTYFTGTPHHQYLAPKTYGRHDFAEKDELNRYLNAVHYVDHFVKNVFRQHKKLGVYEDTIYVIVSDHGEGFGEHGRRQHDNVIWQEGLRIPLLVHAPGRDLPERQSNPVNLMDLLPSLVDLLGYDIEKGEYPGDNMFELDRVRPMHAHCWYERRCMARIVGDEKYIYHFGKRPPEFYDLSEDPMEKNNIISQRDPEKWLNKLLKWRHKINKMYRTYIRKQLEPYLYDRQPSIPHAVDAKFGNYARLLGYDLSSRKVQPGDKVTVTYYFEALSNIPAGWKLFVHGERSGRTLNLDHTPVDGLYPLWDWKKGQIVADPHTFEVPEDWEGDRLTVHLGIWHSDEGRLPIEGDVPTDGERRARILSLQIVPDWDKMRRRARKNGFVNDKKPETVPNKTSQVFDKHIELIGYRTDSKKVRPGDDVQISYWFRVLKDTPPGWRLFVHGVGGDRMENYDHPTANGQWPVERWEEGSYIRDTHTVHIPSDWSADHFDIRLGFWQPSQGRIDFEGPLSGDGQKRVRVTSLEVKQ